MTRVLSALVLVAALAFAGCGSSKSKNPGADAAATTATPAGAAKTTNGAVAISMQNISFSPKAVTVKVGQTVRWTNDDDVDHNVTATAGEKFKSDNFGKGGTYEFLATKAETIKYTCTIHPGMDGTLTVVK